jgi:hypothetical protein
VGASGTELTPIATEDKPTMGEWLYMSDGGKATKLKWFLLSARQIVFSVVSMLG